MDFKYLIKNTPSPEHVCYMNCKEDKDARISQYHTEACITSITLDSLFIFRTTSICDMIDVHACEKVEEEVTYILE